MPKIDINKCLSKQIDRRLGHKFYNLWRKIDIVKRKLTIVRLTIVIVKHKMLIVRLTIVIVKRKMLIVRLRIMIDKPKMTIL